MTSPGKKGTWPQSIITFFSPFLLFLIFRWCIAEPFVIPSGSMIPTLLIHDHVIVTKYSYGLKVPFTDHWLIRWRQPQRGDVIVFRYPLTPDVFYIKRLIGLPGDKVEVTGGKIKVNDVDWNIEPFVNESDNEGYQYFSEQADVGTHKIRFMKFHSRDDNYTYEVPEHNYFFMGDNRDQSSDGRVFGFVEEKLLVGPAKFVWMSCEETLQSVQFICNPRLIRWNRIFTSVK